MPISIFFVSCQSYLFSKFKDMKSSYFFTKLKKKQIHIMVTKRFFFAMFILIISSCGGDLDPLELQKQDYRSNELRVDGYYYTISNSNSITKIQTAICLYRNGLFLDIGLPDLSNLETADDYIKNKKTAFSNLSKPQPYWGLFQISPNKVTIERYEYVSNGNYPTKMIDGVIKNDTTFVILLFKDSDTFRFRAFSPKPDSINVPLRLK